MAAGQVALNILVSASAGNAMGVIGQLGGVLSKLASNPMAAVGLGAAAAGAAVIGFGVASVKMAGDFQSSMTSLVTGAGESQANLGMVAQGILNMAVQTGTSTKQLSDGMYMVESAGFHGAAALQVLQAAAEGAKVGNADLGQVANAVTSALNAYGLQGKDATAVTNELIATVAAGKMHMQDLANSLAAVLPVAAAAHISYAQVGGAIATMTAQGMSAQQATQNLANTIRSLQNPNAQAVSEMQAMGLNANQVALQLGQKGLTGTLQEISQAILAHMGPSGLVLQNAFKSSAAAAQDAKIEIAAMPKSLQSVAQAYLNGTITQKEWSKALSGLDPITKHMMTQFAATAKQTESFNSLLTKGSPAAQTFNAAMAKIMGGATGLNTALMLSGSHMSTFQSNVASIQTAANNSKNGIQGWSNVQSDFNFKMQQIGAILETGMIRFGMALLPILTQAATWFINLGSEVGAVVSFFQQNQLAGDILIGVLTGIAVIIVATVAPAVWTFVAVLLFCIATVLPGMISGLWGMAAAALANPITWIALGIAAAVVLIILAIQHWGQITHWLQGVWAAISSWFMGALHAVGAFFVNIWDSIISFFVGVWNRFQTIIRIIGIALAIIFAPLLLGIALIVAPFVGLFLLFTHFQQVIAFLRTFLQVAWAAIVHIFESAVQTVVGWFSWLYNHNYYFQALVDTIRKVISAVVAWFENAWKTTVANVVAIWNGLKTAAETVWHAIVNGVMAVINTLTHWVEAFWNTEVAGWTRIWNTVKGIFLTVWNAVVSFLTGIWNNITTAVTGLWNKISSIFSSAWNTYIATPLNNIKNSITNFFTGLINQALQWGANLVSSFASGITGAIGKVTGAVQGIMGKVAGFLGFHSPAKEGPGAELDAWGPNLVRGFSSGMLAALPTLQSALNTLMTPVQRTLGSAVTAGRLALPQQAASGGNAFALSGASGGNSFALGGSQPIVVQVQPTSAEIHLDGRKVGESVSKYQNRAVKLQGGYRNN